MAMEHITQWDSLENNGALSPDKSFKNISCNKKFDLALLLCRVCFFSSILNFHLRDIIYIPNAIPKVRDEGQTPKSSFCAKIHSKGITGITHHWFMSFSVSLTALRESTCLWKEMRLHTRCVPSLPRTRRSRRSRWWSPTWIQAPNTRPGQVRSSAPRI